MWNFIIPAAASLIGGAMASKGASSAANAQVASADAAAQLQRQTAQEQMALQREQFGAIRNDQFPFKEAGRLALNRLNQLVGTIGDASQSDWGALTRDFNMGDYQADPGYEFRQAEGMKGLERSASARGGLMSGRAGKDMLRFSQGLASDEYQNAFNRFQVNRANKLNPLQSLAGVGQSATNTLGQAGQNFAKSASNTLGTMAGNVGNAMIGAGNARASGYVGQANAVNNAISQGYGMYQNNQLMDMLSRGGNRYTVPTYDGAEY